MLKTIKIFPILVFTLSICIFGSEKNCKVYYPAYVPQNSSFDISLVTSNNYSNADKLELYILADDKIQLNKIELKSVYDDLKLNFEPAILESYSTPAYKAIIDLSDTVISSGTFFQVLFNFRSSNFNSSLIKFHGIFKRGNEVLGYLSDVVDKQEPLIEANLKFFKSPKKAGRVLQIGSQSQLEISLQKNKVKNLLAEFWIKLNDPGTSILKIKSREDSEFEFEISTNEFQMLLVNSGKVNELSSPFFTSKKSWYHISIYFSGENNSLSFYCNGSLFAKYDLPVHHKPVDLMFSFMPAAQGKTYQLELLRFVDFNNSIEESFRNRNYINFKADSSKVISQFRFDTNEEFNIEKNNINIITADLQFVKSDAPLLARAPELNINLHSNSYELEWGGGDYKQAVSYILERSTEKTEFVPVFTIQADNVNEKSYSFLDEKDEDSEIIYYRIKQINKDGSFVYSSQVKLGQGLLEAFTLGQNYPNPFNPKTSIEIELFEDSDVEVMIYNLEGREIAKLHKGPLSKGNHKFTFDAAELPSGIYLYKVATQNFSQTKKMILTK